MALLDRIRHLEATRATRHNRMSDHEVCIGLNWCFLRIDLERVEMGQLDISDLCIVERKAYLAEHDPTGKYAKPRPLQAGRTYDGAEKLAARLKIQIDALEAK